MSDSADSFFNVNTPADLALAERRLTGARTSPR
jgi:molybdopterin-guanine dinucleotide biosynthesis protein A